jgi:2-amino-4-hydroxy-6-hydroxymethyldihydropteridine diphosphokinase
VVAFVGVGANDHDRLGTIEAVLHVLDDLPDTDVADVSAVYETAPWGGVDDDGVARHVEDQEPYLNAVVRLRTGLSAHALLDELLATETAFGRDRAREERWGTRQLDLDLLLHGDAVIDDGPRLVVPHPRLQERAFVLVPLLEVHPGGVLPDGTRLTRALLALGPLEGIEMHVRLTELPGTQRHVERPEGPGGGGALLADEWVRRPRGEEL